LGLKLKFGESGQELLPEIESIQDVTVLEAILQGIDTSNNVSQLRQIPDCLISIYKLIH
jgi:hypothetical protein